MLLYDDPNRHMGAREIGLQSFIRFYDVHWWLTNIFSDRLRQTRIIEGSKPGVRRVLSRWDATGTEPPFKVAQQQWRRKRLALCLTEGTAAITVKGLMSLVVGAKVGGRREKKGGSQLTRKERIAVEDGDFKCLCTSQVFPDLWPTCAKDFNGNSMHKQTHQ